MHLGLRAHTMRISSVSWHQQLESASACCDDEPRHVDGHAPKDQAGRRRDRYACLAARCCCCGSIVMTMMCCCIVANHTTSPPLPPHSGNRRLATSSCRHHAPASHRSWSPCSCALRAPWYALRTSRVARCRRLARVLTRRLFVLPCSPPRRVSIPRGARDPPHRAGLLSQPAAAARGTASSPRAPPTNPPTHQPTNQPSR